MFNNTARSPENLSRVRTPRLGAAFSLLLLACSPTCLAQSVNSAPAPASAEEVRQLRDTVQDLLVRVAELETLLKQRPTASSPNSPAGEKLSLDPAAYPAKAHLPSSEAFPSAISAQSSSTPSASEAPADHLLPGDRPILDFLHGSTLNFALDEYYAYNFNDPVGRVNALRAYDVLSNNISLNQADLVFERTPQPASGSPFGIRMDLQFGQATDTLQGNPLNEPRPDIYRNIFQAYGTYVASLGNGLTIDVGKWGSSIGIEGNYTKDQINYSRAYWFDFLPFYHMGLRASYKLNDQFTLNYWLVNGTNQTEATNGFKDELFGFTATPRKNISWTFNYYLGQEHPDRILANTSGPVPVQPGLNFIAINPAPNGKLHIFDSYATWQATPKLSFSLEGDYVIQREWATSAPGRSSSPSHTIGGAAYAHYQFSPKISFGARGEYMSDRGGLFSNITQALKETTATFDYKLGEGFLMRYEWRRDFSNQPTFFTDTTGLLSKDQQTATIGFIWWVGRKEGAW